MQIQVTDNIRQLLETATGSQSIAPTLKQNASVYLTKESIPFSMVKSLCLELRNEDGQEPGGPWIHEVCKGSQIILHSPPKRKRSPELEQRLEKLRQQEEERVYQAMVSNVAKHDFEDNSFNLLPTFRMQLSFGAHVLVTMLVFYFVGSYASRIFTHKPAVQALGGVVGLIIGLLLETTLFIVRSIPLTKQKAD